MSPTLLDYCTDFADRIAPDLPTDARDALAAVIQRGVEAFISSYESGADDVKEPASHE